MSVKIAIHDQMVFFVQIICNFSYSITRRLRDWIRVVVISVEVLIVLVHSVMTLINTIRIEHRDNIENKVFSQKVGSSVLVVCKEIQNTIHGMG